MGAISFPWRKCRTVEVECGDARMPTMLYDIANQALCEATLGLIAAGRLFIRGQFLDVSTYLE